VLISFAKRRTVQNEFDKPVHRSAFKKYTRQMSLVNSMVSNSSPLMEIHAAFGKTYWKGPENASFRAFVRRAEPLAILLFQDT
jgi:hypothetical protein